MTKDTPLVVTFTYSKETKRCHRYEADMPEDKYADLLGSVYISKPALKGQKAPQRIEGSFRIVG